MVIALVAAAVLGVDCESDSLTTNDHSPPVSDERTVYVPTHNLKLVSKIIGIELLTAGVPAYSRNPATVPDWKIVPSGYAMVALNLSCWSTPMLVLAVTLIPMLAGVNCGLFVTFTPGPVFPYASLYACPASFAVQTPA